MIQTPESKQQIPHKFKHGHPINTDTAENCKINHRPCHNNPRERNAHPPFYLPYSTLFEPNQFQKGPNPFYSLQTCALSIQTVLQGDANARKIAGCIYDTLKLASYHN